ncbi:histone H1.1-like [Hippopotamus amphibius kiboko]|uniref:histone H1.1-like n=1 Tax=Hippopotamus amphibius kiboko TaxID=575201 RepID=UPI0025934252|nr:histone H1.1-like [Hippopotamus amphibius kiboko]
MAPPASQHMHHHCLRECLQVAQPSRWSETTPPAPGASTPPGEASAGKKAKKPVKAVAAAKKKPAGPSVSELIEQAVSSSKERSGVSLATLKKALAAAGYDVEKNNSRIKLGLKSLVSKGTLVQTKGTGASGSFKLNKKVASMDAKPSAAKVTAKAKVTSASKKPTTPCSLQGFPFKSSIIHKAEAVCHPKTFGRIAWKTNSDGSADNRLLHCSPPSPLHSSRTKPQQLEG